MNEKGRGRKEAQRRRECGVSSPDQLMLTVSCSSGAFEKHLGTDVKLASAVSDHHRHATVSIG